MGSLEGKTAVVTGASSGMGAAIARSFAGQGARVVGGARRVERIPTEAHPLPLDVTEPDSCAAFVEAAVAQLGGIDLLINAAGLALGRDAVEDASEEDEATVIDTNVRGLMRITRLALPAIRDGGHIVNMGSIAGRQPYPNASSYIASKYAVRGYTYALREDLLGRPVRVTTVDAGLVDTEFSVVRFRGNKEAAADVYRGVTPLTAEDIADCVLFAVTRPLHVNVDEIVVKALQQTSGTRVHRENS
jgi:3-hydroxy acid dehydrogenase/malonic semialdehyde reductase